ncbi:MAG: holo-ACP synthase [Proteobacteria bacterium]|nr:holo-ACP synthase [Pseudomonadota bacterium]
MIFGIGLDLLDMTRVERIYDKYGDRFVNHVLTAEEKLQFRITSRKIHFLATRFSGKEAIAKALGIGLREPVTLRSISIISNEIGKPDLFFDFKLKQYLNEKRIGPIFVSFSHEGSLLSAYALAESLG